MKKLYIIGGPMGVGKTAACRKLKNKLAGCVFLDGDWCWDMHPFIVNPDTKKMVMENICFMLNNFIKCPVVENIVFCWVMHEQDIIDEILSRISPGGFEVCCISLVCSKKELTARLKKDVAAGIRDESVIGRSLKRLPLYSRLNTVQIDTTGLSADETAEAILAT